MGSDDLFKKRREVQKNDSGFRQPRANSFLIVTEGEKSEPLYLQGIVQSLINGALQVVSEGKDYVNVGYAYILEKDAEGVEYYLPSAYGSPVTFIENLMGRLAALIPASTFEEMQDSIRIEEEKILERTEYYQNMGLDEYREKKKEIFLANMKKMEEEGIKIVAYSFSNANIT